MQPSQHGALVQGPPRSQDGKRCGPAKQTKAEELKQEATLTSFCFAPSSGTAETTRKFYRLGVDESYGKSQPAELSVLEGTVRACTFRPSKPSVFS